jgi:hypothetical protein
MQLISAALMTNMHDAAAMSLCFCAVVIVGTENTFRGFLVQARSMPSNTLIGAFMEDVPTQQTLDCDNMFPVSTVASH